MVPGYLNFSAPKLRYSRRTENTNSTKKALWEMLYNVYMMTGVFETLKPSSLKHARKLLGCNIWGQGVFTGEFPLSTRIFIF